MSDRRNHPRRRSFLGARVVFAGGFQTYECLVLNFSDAGAELHAAGSPCLPDVFDLEVPLRKKSFRARVCWRNGEWVGVEFTESSLLHA